MDSNVSFGNKIISRLITKVKNREYQLDETIKGSDLFSLLIRRGFMALRGMMHGLLFRESHGFIFIGKNVKIQCHRNIKLGSSANINNNCNINALCKKGITIGNNFTLGEGSVIECSGVISRLGDGLEIGNDVGISAYSFIGVRASVKIGDGTIMGPYTSIHAENHGFDNQSLPIHLQETTRKGINIGYGCWLGAKVTILDGVTIGDECIIAAGAVVTKDIPSYSIAAGVPARVIKMRKK